MIHDELWDDTLLIQQYDAAMDHVKHKVFKQHEGYHFADHKSNESKDNVMMQYSDGYSGDVSLPAQNKKKKKKNRKKLEWLVGTACRCKYSKDGQMYEATITQLEINSPYATVTFVGYENSERVPLVQLYRSKGNAARTSQEKEAAVFIADGESSVDQGNSSSTSEARDNGTRALPSGPRLQHRKFPHMDLKDVPMLDLPPPPPGLGLPAGPDSEELHTMLLSWYMTGYHTGYYRGITASQHNSSR